MQDFQWDVHGLQMVPYIQVETLPVRHTPKWGRGGERPKCPSRATADPAPKTSLLPTAPEARGPRTHPVFLPPDPYHSFTVRGRKEEGTRWVSTSPAYGARKLVAKRCPPPPPPKEQNTLGTLIFNTLKLKGACSRGSFVQEQDPSTRGSDAVP